MTDPWGTSGTTIEDMEASPSWDNRCRATIAEAKLDKDSGADGA